MSSIVFLIDYCKCFWKEPKFENQLLFTTNKIVLPMFGLLYFICKFAYYNAISIFAFWDGLGC